MHPLSNGNHNQHFAIEIKVPEIPGVPDFDLVQDEVEVALTAAEQLWRYFKERWTLLEEAFTKARTSP